MIDVSLFVSDVENPLSENRLDNVNVILICPHPSCVCSFLINYYYYYRTKFIEVCLDKYKNEVATQMTFELTILNQVRKMLDPPFPI